jgi:hypothetical protein
MCGAIPSLPSTPPRCASQLKKAQRQLYLTFQPLHRCTKHSTGPTFSCVKNAVKYGGLHVYYIFHVIKLLRLQSILSQVRARSGTLYY